jgi:hypothetical protein
MPRTQETSAGLARLVHWSLLGGLSASGLLLISGLVLALTRHQPRPPGPPPRWSALLDGVCLGDGLSMLYLGLWLLMLTPVLRCVVLCAAWSAEKQWRFAGIAACVLALLALSVALGTS